MTDELLESLDKDIHTVAFELYRKAIRFGTWDPQSIDLTVDKQHFEQLDDDLKAYLVHFCTGFWNAEENVALKFCPWIMSAPSVEMQMFLSTQLLEEFKHTEFFMRYFKEVIGRDRENKVVNLVQDRLDERARQLLLALDSDPDTKEAAFVEGITHYQGVIEGVQAMAGYDVFDAIYGKKGLFPGLAEGFTRIKEDEGRHVGFGLRLLKQFARQKPEYASRIQAIYEEYFPLIMVRYDQPVFVEGREIPTPPELKGKDRLKKLFDRRLQDIFGTTNLSRV